VLDWTVYASLLAYGMRTRARLHKLNCCAEKVRLARGRCQNYLTQPELEALNLIVSVGGGEPQQRLLKHEKEDSKHLLQSSCKLTFSAVSD
jgi:hypothetical protein